MYPVSGGSGNATFGAVGIQMKDQELFTVEDENGVRITYDTDWDFQVFLSEVEANDAMWEAEDNGKEGLKVVRWVPADDELQVKLLQLASDLRFSCRVVAEPLVVVDKIADALEEIANGNS